MAKIELAKCALCKEKLNSMHPVPGEGPKDTKICLLAHMPGKQENIKVRPFMGPAKEKLEKGLTVANLTRESVYITNVYKCYTAGKVASEVSLQLCRDVHLNAEMALLKDLKLVVAMGNAALAYFSGDARVSDLHGTTFMAKKPWSRGDEKIMVFVSYDPAAALRDAVINERFFNDMKILATISV